MSNPFLWFFVIGLLAIGFFLRDIANPAKRGVAKYTNRTLKKYRRANSLMNPAELRLYKVLKKRFDGEFIVVVKPRLGDLIVVSETVRNFKSRRALRSRVASRHVDYALLRENGSPVACVELDGKDHGKSSVRRADKFKNELCAQVGIMMFRIPAKADYKKAVKKISIT